MIAKNKLYIKSPPPSTYSYSQKIFHFFLKKNLKKKSEIYFIYSAPPKNQKKMETMVLAAIIFVFFSFQIFFFGKKINLYKMYTL